MADAFVEKGYKVISGGTDNHSMLIDLRPKGINGRLAENTLIKADITVNKNMVPFDTEKAMITSGMRVGTAAMTTRGLKEADMVRIVEMVDTVLVNNENEGIIATVRGDINDWMAEYPLFTM